MPITTTGDGPYGYGSESLRAQRRRGQRRQVRTPVWTRITPYSIPPRRASTDGACSCTCIALHQAWAL